MLGDICDSSEAVVEDDTAHVFDLGGCCFSASGLEIEDFCHALLAKDVVTPTNTLSKAQTPPQVTEPVKGNIRVRNSA